MVSKPLSQPFFPSEAQKAATAEVIRKASDEKMNALTTKLAEQFASGRKPETQGHENFMGIGYEF